MTVEESNDFPVLGADSDDAWASLASPTFGHVRLGDADRLFMVTMYHEFHCLRILNLAFGRAEIAGLAHIRHCLNYLRLGALCASDLTLEPGDFERRDFDHERTGATHTCRDWRAAGRIMEDNLYAWRNKTGTLLHLSFSATMMPAHEHGRRRRRTLIIERRRSKDS